MKTESKIFNRQNLVFIAKSVIFLCILISLSLVFKSFETENLVIKIAISIFFLWLIFFYLGNTENDGLQKNTIKELLTEIEKRENEWEGIRSDLYNLIEGEDFEGGEMINSSELDKVLTKMDNIDNEKERRIEEDYNYYGYFKLGDIEKELKGKK